MTDTATPRPAADEQPGAGPTIPHPRRPVDDDPQAPHPTTARTAPRPPVVPDWLHAPVLHSHAVRAGRTARWHACFHTVRLPLYGYRLSGRVMRGAGVVARAVGRWLAAREYNAAIAAAKDADRALVLHQTRKGHRIRRTVLLLIGGGSGVAALVWATPTLVLVGIASGSGVGLTLLGRKPDRPVLDATGAPATLVLAPDHLNAAFRAAGMLKPDTALTLCKPILQEGRGWAVLADLPMGGGKTAAHAIARGDVIAAELGVDEIQLIMSRVRAHDGGHGRRLSMWVADDDPYLGAPTVSMLASAERMSLWEPVPFGRDARGTRISLELIWQSMFFGGLPRRGKTFSMRLLVALAALDPWCRIYLADGKGGADFRAIRGVAHRYISGADDAELAAFEAMLDELITEMTRRFALFATLPTSVCPEGKLTPQLMTRYNLPLVPVVIDELQEYFDAIDQEADRKRIISKLARIARRGPAAGFIPVYASQRPDAKSVPTKLREIVTYRYCTQVTDKTSSDMVLGDGKANQGADASILSEEHKGVGVLVTGPASFVVVKCDLLGAAEFEEVCRRGRALRITEGTLSGDATIDVQAAADEAGYVIPAIIGDVLEAMGSATRMHTDQLLARLVNLDEDTYGDYDAEQFAAELERAGVTRTMKQVKIDGANRAGYLRRDIEGAVPVEILATHRAEHRERPTEDALPDDEK